MVRKIDQQTRNAQRLADYYQRKAGAIHCQQEKIDLDSALLAIGALSCLVAYFSPLAFGGC